MEILAIRRHSVQLTKSRVGSFFAVIRVLAARGILRLRIDVVHADTDSTFDVQSHGACPIVLDRAHQKLEDGELAWENQNQQKFLWKKVIDPSSHVFRIVA